MPFSSHLQNLLERGHYVLSAELTPPRGFDLGPLGEHARRLHPYVDVVQLNDQLLSQARCSTMVAAARVRELGLEPVLQFSLRHRNRIAVQSELLGMAALGLRNLIVLGGYPIAIGSDPTAKDATDLTVPQALAGIAGLTTEGRMFNGDQLAQAPVLYPGTIEIPCMSEAEIPASLDKLAGKIAAGARYIQVQAVFDLPPMQRWMQAVVQRGLHRQAHFIAAVFPFSGAERLRFLQTVPGLCIPEHLMHRVQSRDGDAASLEITLELIAGIRAMQGLSGLHLRSISAEDWVPRILEAAGLRKATEAAPVTPVNETAKGELDAAHHASAP